LIHCIPHFVCDFWCILLHLLLLRQACHMHELLQDANLALHATLCLTHFLIFAFFVL
jgi:hypothetical protein